MSCISRIKYFMYVFWSGLSTRVSFLIAALGMIVGRVWESETQYEVYWFSFRWENLLIGPITAMILLLSTCIKFFQDENKIVHYRNRRTIFWYSIFLCGFVGAFISIWVNLLIFAISKASHITQFANTDIELQYGIKNSMDVLGIVVRTNIMMWLLCFILGLLYMLVQFLWDKMIYSILIVFLVVGAEEAGKFYFGKQLFMKYVFPADSYLYFTWDGFREGVTYLVLFIFVLICLLYLVIEKKDFYKKQKGIYTIS